MNRSCIVRDFKRQILPAPHRPHPHSWSDTGLHAAWLGHTTVLLKIDGVTILTDPVFSTRAGIGLGPLTLGLKTAGGTRPHPCELPKIDLVLLSHAHMDHFDIRSLRRLGEPRHHRGHRRAHRRPAARPAATPPSTNSAGANARSVGPLEIRAFQVKHWGARMRSDTYRGYNGYTIEAGRYRVLFGGDTAMTDVVPLAEVLAPLRSRHHAGGRVQPVDPLPLHPGAGLADGAGRRRGVLPARAPPDLQCSAASPTSSPSSESAKPPASHPDRVALTASASNST